MSSTLASIIFALLIFGLFWLDRDRGSRVSVALWIPVIWWLLACSRSVNQWLNLGAGDQFLTSDAALLEGSPIDRLVYGVLEALGLIVLVWRRAAVLGLLRENGAVLIFFIYAALSISWSDYPEVAWKRWTKAIGDLVMVLVVLSDGKPRAAFERLLVRTTYFLVPLSVLMIKYYPAIGRMTHRWTYKTSYVGVALNKNALGMICLLCGLASVWRFLVVYQETPGSVRTRRLVAQGVILGMVLWLFWLANSMTSLACFIIGIAILLLRHSRGIVLKPGGVHFLVAAILAVTIPVLFFNLTPGVLETMGRNPTLTDRTEMWPLLISLGGNHLIGTGYESFWLGPRLEQIWNVYSWGPREAHNGYVEIFLNLGWVGVVLLAVVMVAGYKKVFASWDRNPSIGGLMLAYFIVGVVYNFTEAAFFRMMTPVWIFLLLAIIGAHVLANHNIGALGAGNFKSRSASVPDLPPFITPQPTKVTPVRFGPGPDGYE